MSFEQILAEERDRQALAAGSPAPPPPTLPAPELEPDPVESPAQPSGFDQIVASERAREQSTALAARRASQVDPASRRKAQVLAEEFGAPLFMVESDLPKFEQRYKEKQARQAVAQLPALAEGLNDPSAPTLLEDAPLLKDLDERLRPPEIDMGLLARFPEGMRRQAQNIRQSVLAWKVGYDRASPAEVAEYEALRTSPPAPLTNPAGPWDEIMEATGGVLPYVADVSVAGAEGYVAGALGGGAVGAGVGSLAGGVGAVPGAIAGAQQGGATGARIAAMYRITQIEGGGIYDQLRDISDEIKRETGQEVPKAVIQGLMATGGITNAMLESWSLKTFAKGFPGGKFLLAKLARPELKAMLLDVTKRSTLARAGAKVLEGIESVATNGIQEGLQGISPRIAARALTKAYLDPNAPVWTAEDSWGVVSDAVMGAAGGFGIAAMGVGSSAVTRVVAQAAQSKLDLARLDHQVEKAGESKLATEDPEAFRRMISRINTTKDGDRAVFVAPDVLVETLGPEVIAELPGLESQIAEAQHTKGEVVIRLEDYLTDLREYHQALSKNIRIGLTGASQQEIGFNEKLQAELAKTNEGQTPAQESSQRIYDWMFEKGIQAKMSIEEARAHATQYQAKMTQLAAEVGEDPGEFFDREIGSRLEIQGPPSAPEVTGPSLDDMLEPEKLKSALATLQTGQTSLKFPAHPVLGILKNHGGVDPASPLAGELRNMGVTSQSHPGLYREGGLEDLDNLDIADNPVLVGNLQLPEGDYRYSPRDLLDAIDKELRGKPLRSEEQIEALEAVEEPARELKRHLDELGIDVHNATPEQVLELLQRSGVHRPEAGETNIEDGVDPEATTYEQPSANALAVKGLQKILPLLTEAERKNMNAGMANALVTVWAKIGDLGPEAATMAWTARQRRGWYKNSGRTLVAMFGKDAPRFTALLAALSPQIPVQRNLEAALRVWAWYKQNGGQVTQEQIEALFAERVEVVDENGEVTLKSQFGTIPSATPGAVLALLAEDPLAIKFGGEKVDSFYRNLMGEVDRVTLDTHMGAFFGWGIDFGRRSDYLAVSALIRKAAKILSERTGEEWTPDEIQETIWSWIYVAKEKAKKKDPKTGKTRTLVDIAKGEGISEAEFDAVPDFDSLLFSTKYQQLMEGLGLGAELESLRSSDAGARSAADRRTTTLEQEDGGLARDAQRQQLVRAATRAADYVRQALDAGRAAKAAKAARDAAKRAEREPTTFFQKVMKAYHGTGAAFDKFLADFIGTGEGTANQGWGFYFTSAQSAMKFYAKQMAHKKWKFGWTVPPGSTFQVPPDVARALDNVEDLVRPQLVANAGSYTMEQAANVFRIALARAAENARRVTNENPERTKLAGMETWAASNEAALALVESGEVDFAYSQAANPTGVGLEVSIPADNQLLDWSRSLANQPAAVREKLAQLPLFRVKSYKTLPDAPGRLQVSVPGMNRFRTYFSAEDAEAARANLAEQHPDVTFDVARFTPDPDISGEEFYADLSSSAESTDLDADGARAASLLLLSAGIKGHVYESGHGNINYVIYDPDSVAIIQRLFQEQSGDERSELGVLQAAIADAVRRGDETESEKLRDRAREILDTMLEQPARGSFTFDPKFRELLIRLSKSADASTFIHESGHLFLELMLRTSERLDASQRLKDNAAATLDWLGAGSRQEITREMHEKFARAYEAYLWEGKAPSLALRDTFARFSTWLLRVYRTMRHLNVTLDDDIRGVFDRMLASDEAIAEARRVQGFMPAFKDAATSPMTEQEFADYQVAAQRTYDDHRRKLMQETLKDLERKKTAEYIEARDRITEQVVLDVNSRPVFRARAWLQSGKVPKGTLAPALEHKKLDRAALVRLKGPEILKVFRPGKYSLWQKEGGHDPEVIARVFGFDSADRMLNAFATTASRQEVIALEVQERLARRFGNVFRDGRLPEMALQASMTDEQGAFLVSELKALRRVVPTQGERERGQELPARVLRRAAQRAIAGRLVRDLRQDVYRSQEQRAAMRAAEAVLARDWQTAADEKRAEVLNHFLAIEAREARDQAEKDRAYLLRMGTTGARAKLGKAGHDYLAQVDALLFRFKFGPITKAASEERETLEKWITAQEANGAVLAIPDKIRNEAFTVDWKGMTVEDLTGLADSVRSIERQAQRKNTLILGKERRDFADTRDTSVASIQQNSVRDVRHLDPRDSRIDAIQSFARSAHGIHTKLEALFKRLDGGKLGFMWELCFKPFADAEAAEQEWMRELSGKLEATFKKLRKANPSRGAIDIPAIGRSLTFEKRLVVALNQGNEYNKNALLQGEDWSQQQVDAVLETLTEADWTAVRELAALVESTKERSFALHERLTGVRPESVDPSAVITKYGVYTGWYWPLKADPLRSHIALKREEAQSSQDLFQGNAFKPMTRQGHLQARTDFGKQPVLLSLSVLSEHLFNVVHDVTHREALIQVDRITQDKAVAGAITDAVGREMYLQIRPWLKGIAGERLAPIAFLEPSLGWIRQGVSISYMGFKASVMISQSLGIFQAIGPEGVGAVRLSREMAAFMVNPREAQRRVKWALEMSPALRSRLTNFDRDARDAIKRGAFATSGLGQAHAGFVQYAMLGIGLCDMVITVPTWIAAYGRAIEEGKAVERAVDEADSVVRLTMGAGGVKDLAAVQRGGEFLRMMTGFYSAISAIYNQWGLTIAAIRDGRMSLPEVAHAAMFMWILPALAAPLLARRGPDDDEDWWKWAFSEVMFYPASLAIGLRDLAGAGERAIKGEWTDVSLPALETLETTATALFGSVASLATEGELSRKNVKDIVNTIGVWGHLPSRQSWITLESLYDLDSGKVEGLDLLLTRPKERRSAAPARGRAPRARPAAAAAPIAAPARAASSQRQVVRDEAGLIREIVGEGKRTLVKRDEAGRITELQEVPVG